MTDLATIHRKPGHYRLAAGVCVIAVFVTSTMGSNAAMNKDEAKAFLKSNKCTKCHSVTKTKKGPSYKINATEHRDNPNAMDELYKQVTTGPTVEFQDGTEEEHKILDCDPSEIREMLQWIPAL